MLRQFTMKVDGRLIVAVKAHAARRGISVSELVRDLLGREIGWTGGAAMPFEGMSDAEIKLRLRRYADGRATRRDVMDGLGMDPSDVQAFARLMNGHGIPWPKPDRSLAEEGAAHLVEAMREGRAGDGA